MSPYVPRPCDLIVGAPCDTQWLPVLPTTTSSSSLHLSTFPPASPGLPESSTFATSTATSSAALSSKSAPTLLPSSSSPLLSSPSSQPEGDRGDMSTHFGATAGVALGIGAVVTAVVAVTVIYAFRHNYHRKGRASTAAVANFKGVADGDKPDEVKVCGDDTGTDGRDVPDARERRSSVNSETLLFRRYSQQDGSLVVQRTSVDGGSTSLVRTVASAPVAVAAPRKLRKPRPVVVRTVVNASPSHTRAASLDLPPTPREDGSESDEQPSEGGRSRGPRSDMASVGGSTELPSYADDGREHRDGARKIEDRRSEGSTPRSLPMSLPPSYSQC